MQQTVLRTTCKLKSKQLFIHLIIAFNNQAKLFIYFTDINLLVSEISKQYLLDIMHCKYYFAVF